MDGTITILGSTGSIGESTLRVLRSLNGRLRVYGLACARNLAALERQMDEFAPAVVAVDSADALATVEYRDLKKRHPGVEFLEGEQGVIELAGRPVDVVLSAVVGSAGLRPALAALGRAKRLALANKETIVMAGDIVMKKVRESGTELVPVDSEHGAVFMLMESRRKEDIERIILTASGGSLRDADASELATITPERALAHPTWDMGSKITIDSATLMNKGLEVIEAHHMFGAPFDRIDVLIHPESIVHSMIETVDGIVYAHMGVTDMVFPILNALSWPEKLRNPFGKLKLDEVGTLHFSRPDTAKYPALDLCYDAGRCGGTMPAVLNAANEVAVGAFLDRKIAYTGIVSTVEKTMRSVPCQGDPGLDDLFAADTEARAIAQQLIKEHLQ